MSKFSDKQFSPLLQAVGFTSEGRQTWTHWLWRPEQANAKPPEGHAKPLEKSRKKLSNPWHLDALSLAERKGSISIHGIELTLDKNKLRDNLAILTRKYFGVKTHSEIIEGKDGELWCLFEFHKPRRRDDAKKRESLYEQAHFLEKLPFGAGGFCIRLAADTQNISIMLSGFFGLGYVPNEFFTLPTHFTRNAFCLKDTESFGQTQKNISIYEWSCPTSIIALRQLSQTYDPLCVTQIYQNLNNHPGHECVAIVDQNNSWKIIYPTDTESLSKQSLSMLATAARRIPVDVLEAREQNSKYQEIDRLIINGKSRQAIEKIQSSLISEPKSLYLIRRLAMAAICEIQAIDPQILDIGLTKEPENELFLSAAAASAIAAREHQKVLDNLSKMGSLLLNKISDADSLRTFEVVLPELLGDAWANTDLEKSRECYSRIIERRGDTPRILKKLIRISRQLQRSDIESRLLTRLAGVERRKVELAKIYLRHAEIRQSYATGKEEALELALKSFHLNRTDDRAATLVSRLLLENGKPHEAIQILDSVIKDVTVAISQKTRAIINAEIADIWHNKLNRSDLAEIRFEKAIIYNRRDLKSISNLEIIYRKNDDPEKLANILEIKFEYYEHQNEGNSLKKIFDELAFLYRHKLGKPKRAYELYQRLIANTLTSAAEIELIMNWSEIEIDWNSLYQSLAAKLSEYPEGEKKSQYICRLAEICQTRLNDTALAMRHFLNSLDSGWITDSGFQFVAQTLSNAHDYPKLVTCYAIRLNQTRDDKKPALIQEMLQIPKGISDDRRDELALKAYLIDKNFGDIISQRLRHYQQTDNISGLNHIYSMLLSEADIPISTRVHWLRIGITTAQGFQTIKKYEFIAKLYRELLEIDDNELQTLHEAILNLEHTPNQSDLIYFVSRLLKTGQTPQIDERAILRLLARHDNELAEYHKIISMQSKTPEVAATHARTAAAIYGRLPNQETNTEAMLIRLCTLAPCAEDDLIQLSHLCSITKNYTGLAKSLQKQADFEDEKKRKFNLLDQLAQIYWRKLKDYGRARLTYILAIKIAPDPTRIKLLLAQIAGDAGDPRSERKALSDFLIDPHCTHDLLAMTAAIARLAKIGEEKRIIQKLVSPHIDNAINAGQPELAGQIAQALIDNESASIEIFRTAFRAAVAVHNDQRAKFCWWNGLSLVSDKARAKLFINETKQILEKGSRKDLLLDCFQEALSQRIDERLGPKIKREILIQFGALLFESDSKRQQALTIYTEAYKNDSEDSRAWMPLYFLQLEFGTVFERFRHLCEIIPKLDADPRPLKNFPITIESLKSELKDLNAEIQKTRNPFIASDNRIPENLDVLDQHENTNKSDQSVIDPKELVNSQIYDISKNHNLNLPKIPQSEIELTEFVKRTQEIRSVSGENIEFKLSKHFSSRDADSRQSKISTLSLVQQDKSETESDSDKKDGSDLTGREPIGNIKPGITSEIFQLPDNPNLPPFSKPLTTPYDAVANLPGFPTKQDKYVLEHITSDVKKDADALTSQSEKIESPRINSVVFDLGDEEKSQNPTEQDLAKSSKGIGAQIAEASSESKSIELIFENPESLSQNQSAPQVDISPDSDNASTQLIVADTANLKDTISYGDFEAPPLLSSIDTQNKSHDDTLIPSSNRYAEKTSDSKITKANSDGSSITTILDQLEPSSQNRNSILFSELDVANDDTSNWRASVTKCDFNADLTDRLLKQAFASELEKHIAIQSVAVVAGNCDKLNSWHWRVWRKPNEYGYKLSSNNRFAPEMRSPLLDSNLLKLVVALGPTLRYAYRERFSLVNLGKKLEIQPSAIEKLRKPLDWKSGLLKEIGIHLLEKSISSKNLKIFNISGLERDIFFDGSAHAFYFDESYYRKAPPSHLFHRLSHKILSLHLRYFVPLSLHPTEDFFPLIQAIHHHLGSSSLSRFRSRISGNSPFAKVISRVDLRETKSLIEKTGMPTGEQLVQLWEALQLHIYRLQIAETLNIIGIFEAITDLDFLKPGTLRHSQILELSPITRPLLEFITMIKL